jgi:hypothetical protein
MDKTTAAALLADLEQAETHRDALRLAQGARLKAIEDTIAFDVAQLTAQINALRYGLQPALDVVYAECSPAITEAEDAAIAAEDAAKAAVVALGASVKGERLHAVYTKGRETWDGKLLSGYAIAHSDVLACRNIGAPSVSIRAAK